MRYLEMGLHRALRVSGGVALALAISSCATGTALPAATWSMVDASKSGAMVAEAARARVVVFRLAREGESRAQEPLNIFFNNSYHASLMPDAHAAVLSMCPGVGGLRVEEGGTPGHATALDASEAIEMKAGGVYYYQVGADDAGKAAVRLVDASQAEGVVGALPLQSHTISRVVADTCAVQAEVPTEVFNLNGETLFSFDRSDLAGMLPGGRDELKRIVENVMKDYVRIDRVVVKGHTDPTGKAAYNQKLSERRASSVAKALIAAGLASDRVTFEGLGESKLVVANCVSKGKGAKAINACNQPNRRVEIDIFGERHGQATSPAVR